MIRCEDKVWGEVMCEKQKNLSDKISWGRLLLNNLLDLEFGLYSASHWQINLELELEFSNDTTFSLSNIGGRSL